MSYLLLIDTAVGSASVCLAQNDQPLTELSSPTQKDSAAWLHPAIEELLRGAGLSLQQIDAVVVSSGPGSYTGLRVGMAAAKGLCYALQKPLITINTLLMMAAAAQTKTEGYLCPMIDARRMEIFTAVYDKTLKQIMPPCNMIVSENPFLALLEKKQVTFFGNGCQKLQPLLQHPQARFATVEASAKHLSQLGFSSLQKKEFADLAYVEPFYGKEFYTPQKGSDERKSII